MLVPQRAAERRAGVGGAGRHPHAAVVGIAEDAGVGHAVERHATGQAQVARGVAGGERAHDVQHGLLGGLLQRVGKIAVVVGDGLTPLPRRPEHVEELARERAHLAVAVVAQIIAVERELPAFLEMDEVLELVRISIAAAGGERHHGAFLEGRKAQMIGDEGVEHAERVEEAAAPAAFEPVAAADVGAGGRHVSEAVHHQHCRLLERRGEEDGGVRVVVADLDDGRQPGDGRSAGAART